MPRRTRPRSRSRARDGLRSTALRCLSDAAHSPWLHAHAGKLWIGVPMVPDREDGRLNLTCRKRPGGSRRTAAGRLPPSRRTSSEWLELAPQEAEFVAFRIGQDVPALGARLADIGGPGAESKQSLQLSVLVAIGGVDVDVQSELPRPRVAAWAEDEGGLRAAEADIGRPDLDASVVLPAEFDVAQDIAPECGKPVGVGGVNDQLTDAACHGGQSTETTHGRSSPRAS